jgi:hypothetical protein
MNYGKYKKYVRRVCIHVNNTLNSQIKYWKGQKRDIREGKDMQWSSRPRSRVGWGICITLNAPPNLGTSLLTRKYVFNKIQSLNKIRENVRGSKWIIQTTCIHCGTV